MSTVYEKFWGILCMCMCVYMYMYGWMWIDERTDAYTFNSLLEHYLRFRETPTCVVVVCYR